MGLPTDSQERKDIPVWSGFVAYFPDAIAAVAMLSQASNVKHNGPDAPLQWAKGKSTDEEDAGMRHAMEPLMIGSTPYDASDGFAHKVKKAWRAMAELQRFLEAGNPARAFIPGVSPCGGAMELGGVRYPCMLKVLHGGPCSYKRAPAICSDCGVDLEEQAHAAGCLRLNRPFGS